jgi:hypothetical protein
MRRRGAVLLLDALVALAFLLAASALIYSQLFSANIQQTAAPAFVDDILPVLNTAGTLAASITSNATLNAYLNYTFPPNYCANITLWSSGVLQTSATKSGCAQTGGDVFYRYALVSSGGTVPQLYEARLALWVKS